jgi:hypothetical protein
MDMEKILDRLEELKAEALRLYEANGKAAFESGRYDGVKWCIEEIERMRGRA